MIVPILARPDTSMRNLTGTSGPHGASTFTVLVLSARSSVLTIMPGTITSDELGMPAATGNPS